MTLISSSATRNLEVFTQSMRVLSRQLARAASDRELLGPRNLGQKARAWLGSVATGKEAADVLDQR